MANIRVTPVKFSKEFSDLVRAVGECKSKTEEDRIVLREIDTLRHKLTDPSMDRTRIKEFIVRLIYIETLGHDASFGYIHAVKLCSDPSLVNKKVGYLASALFLHENHELILLLINTITRDLRSDNFMIVCAALEATCKLINAETAPAVLPHVMDLLKHPRELVRKKAASALHRFLVKNPSMREELDRPLRALLCDKDPSVMAATLPALEEAIRQDPAPLRSLTGSLVAILKQVLDQRLPKTYDYHKQPAPFIQIRLLKILALLCRADRPASEAAYAVLGECLRRAQASGNTIGYAIICEAVRTIAACHPHPGLLNAATDSLALFLRPGAPHNLKYAGIGLLGDLIAASPEAAAQHQMAVIDCLEDPDESLQARTLGLLGRMCNPSNAVVIADRMMHYLLATSDDEIRGDLALRIYALAERFAPSAPWFLALGMKLLEATPPGPALPKLQRAFISAVMEGADPELRAAGLRLFLAPLAEPSAPVGLLHVCIWAVGELVADRTVPEGAPLDLVEVTRLLAGAGERMVAQGAAETAGLAVTAVTKVALQLPPGAAPAPEAAALLRGCASSRVVDLSERACEAEALLLARETGGMGAARLLGAVYRPPTPDLMLEDGAETEGAGVDESLAFLDAFVAESLAQGAKPYAHPDDRHRTAAAAALPDDPHRHLPGGKAGLRFEAYQPAVPVASRVPVPGAVSQDGPMPSAASADALMDLFGGPSAAPSAAGPSSGPDPLFTPQQQAFLQQHAAAAAAVTPPAALNAPAAPAAAPEPKLQVGQRRWGPARFEDPAPPPQAPPQAPAPAPPRPLPQMVQADLSRPVMLQPGAPMPIGFVGFVPNNGPPVPVVQGVPVQMMPAQAAAPAPAPAPAPPRVDPEKSRLASALFGGGGAGQGAGIRKSSPVPTPARAEGASAAGPSKAPAPGLLDMDLLAAPPKPAVPVPPPAAKPPHAAPPLESLADILSAPPAVTPAADPFLLLGGAPTTGHIPTPAPVHVAVASPPLRQEPAPTPALVDPFALPASAPAPALPPLAVADPALFPVHAPQSMGLGGRAMGRPQPSPGAAPLGMAAVGQSSGSFTHPAPAPAQGSAAAPHAAVQLPPATQAQQQNPLKDPFRDLAGLFG